MEILSTVMDFEIDVIFEVWGLIFFIEVNRFETIRDVKDKIQTIYHIPISQQIFVFKGKILQDHLYVYTTPILHHSRIHLFLAATYVSNLAPPSVEPAQPELQKTLPNTKHDTFIMAIVKMPKSGYFHIECDIKDTVGNLKDKIAAHKDMQGVHLDRIVLHSHSMRQELKDHLSLKDYAIENSEIEIDVFLKPSLPVAGSDKLKVKVLPMLTRKRINVEVFYMDAVSVLKPKLKKLQRVLGFRLPKSNGYFFIHKQQDMYEDRSFRWHGVSDGDTIETFDGFIITKSSS